MAATPVTANGSVENMNGLPDVQKLSLNENGDDHSSVASAPDSSGYATPLTIPNPTSTSSTNSMSGAVRTPFLHALPSCTPIERPGLTTEESAKYATVLQTVSDWTELPTTSARHSPKSPIADSERMWLTRECILRYLRATNWSTNNAAKRLSDTLVWRREYGVESITADMVSVENETGKQVLLGYDNNARPCLYLNPGRQNTKKSDRQIQHLVYMLERTVDMMDAGQDTCALLINFKNATSGGSPSVGQGRQTMTILQGHYPERLGRALISELPWFITTFFRLISPFIDPVTREKMVFNPDLTKYVPPAQLDKEYGGDADFKYDHPVYWPAVAKICEQRRAEYTKRWVQGGKMVGEYEAYLRGGDHKSLVELSNGFTDGHPIIPVDSNNALTRPRSVGE